MKPWTCFDKVESALVYLSSSHISALAWRRVWNTVRQTSSNLIVLKNVSAT